MKFLPFFKISGRAGGGQNHSVGFLDTPSSLAKGTSVMSLFFKALAKKSKIDSWPFEGSRRDDSFLSSQTRVRSTESFPFQIDLC